MIVQTIGEQLSRCQANRCAVVVHAGLALFVGAWVGSNGSKRNPMTGMFNPGNKAVSYRRARRRNELSTRAAHLGIELDEDIHSLRLFLLRRAWAIFHARRLRRSAAAGSLAPCKAIAGKIIRKNLTGRLERTYDFSMQQWHSSGRHRITRLCALIFAPACVVMVVPCSSDGEANLAYAANERLEDTQESEACGNTYAEDFASVNADQLGGDPEVRCAVPGSPDCVAKCAAIRANCAPLAVHPYKTSPSPGALYWCKGGLVSWTCSWKYPNGDNCTLVYPLMKWFCLYPGGK